MAIVKLSSSQARKIILHASGLAKRAQFGKGKEAVYKVINHLGFVQIDTNSVVERAHHHALACRVPGYQHQWLEELQAEGRIFESFSFAAGYSPTDLYRFALPVKQHFRDRKKDLAQSDINMMHQALDRISREGPLMARNFENDRSTKSSGWWNWRPSKLALERLCLYGEIMICARKGFEKVYDLPENILPADVNKSLPEEDEYIEYLIRSALQTHGIAGVQDIAHIYGGSKIKSSIKAKLAEMTVAGNIYEVEIKDLKSPPLYMLPVYRKKKVNLEGNIHILSPFDILNVFRHRLKTFFDFDYQVECFVPKPKRRYGYFSLPVLDGDTFIARMDSKAERKARKLIIFNIHFESKGVSTRVVSRLCDAIRDFAVFNGCPEITVGKSNVPSALKLMRKTL